VAGPYPVCYLNGEYLPLEAARISPLDRGFLFADGVYEVIPVHRGRPFRLAEHLQRLDRSLEAIRLGSTMSHAAWLAIIESLVSRGGEPEQLVYVQVTRGAEHGRNHLFPKGVTPTVFAYSGPFPAPAAATLADGIEGCLLDDIRWARCDIKSIALLANILLRQTAADAGAAEALLVRDGYLTEGSSSTVFICLDGVLVTPPNDHLILPGTTRDAVLEIVDWMPHAIRKVACSELASADEIWIGSAGRGVLPVARLDGRPVGGGKPGPHWQRTYTAWQRHLDAIAASPPL